MGERIYGTQGYGNHVPYHLTQANYPWTPNLSRGERMKLYRKQGPRYRVVDRYPALPGTVEYVPGPYQSKRGIDYAGREYIFYDHPVMHGYKARTGTRGHAARKAWELYRATYGTKKGGSKGSRASSSMDTSI